MSDVRSASMTAVIALTDSGQHSLAFTRNTTVTKNIRQDQAMGIGDFKTRDVVQHAIQYSGNFSRLLVITQPLTMIGFEPTDETRLAFNAPSLFFPDLVTGNMALAIYKLYIATHSYQVITQQTLNENLSFACLNVLDAYELGM